MSANHQTYVNWSRQKTALAWLPLLLASLVLLGGCGGEQEEAQKWTMDASWAYGTRTLETQTELAEIVVMGEVTKVDPARWNSPDGQEWMPADEGSLALVYTTFYVRPEKILKGASKFGEPVPFRVVGGIIGDATQIPAGDNAKFASIAPGQQVVVFGADDGRYGPEGYWFPAAYWLLSDVNSMWRLEGGKYACLGTTDRKEEQQLEPAQLESAIAGYLTNY